MNAPLTDIEIAKRWADITIERFRANIKRLRIVDTETLYNSFQEQVIGAAGGDELKVKIAYAIWGQFQDMGVGRGMKAGTRRGDDGYDQVRNSRGQLLRHERKAKPWSRKELPYQSHRLAELISEAKGQILISTILDALPAQPVSINL